jgi:hypothetical protein
LSGTLADNMSEAAECHSVCSPAAEGSLARLAAALRACGALRGSQGSPSSVAIHLVSRQRVAEQLVALQNVLEFADLVPVSAVDGFQVAELADLLVARLPEGPQLYPDGELTDEPEATLIAELVREAALRACATSCPTRSQSPSRRSCPARGGTTCSTSTRCSTSSAQPEGHRPRAQGGAAA